ncbi:MAG: SDR family NAD(P)-dependent oxidoreductase [Bacteroidota bacterium]
MSQKGKYDTPLKATINGIIEMFKTKERIGTLAPDDRIDGKTCLVTGANTGLGFAIATQLAQRGGHVIMACRSGIPEAGERVKQLSGSDKVEMMKIDLADLNAIEHFIQQLGKRQIDIAVFNAAVVPKGSKKTPQGLEQMFMVNYLAKFVLLQRLLKNGNIANRAFGGKSGEIAPRIIFISSESHRPADALDFQTLGDYQEFTMSKVIKLYGYYKLAMNTFATELSRRLNPSGMVDVSVHALCPGPVNSDIARNAPKVFKPLVKVMFNLFFQSPEKAAEPAVYLACSPDVEGKTDIYLHLMAQKPMAAKALDPEAGKKIWARSAGLLAEISSAQHS